MEVQAECVEPPAAPHGDPEPTGKINKAAFKLFGKRRTGSGMASFFSFRNKGAASSGSNGNSDNGNSANGNSLAASAELIRSKTLDGLTSPGQEGDGQKGEGPAGQGGGAVRSLSKSLSFFSLLRRGSFRSGDGGGAGLSRRGRGLKGLFSSMRWRRREKTGEGEEAVLEGRTAGEAAPPEEAKDITLTLEPPPHDHQEDCGSSQPDVQLQLTETPPSSDTATPPLSAATPGPSGEPESPPPYTPTDSPLRPSVAVAKASVSSLTPPLATPPLDHLSVADPPSEPSVDRLCSLLFTDVTSLKSFDSLTGCGDIIADAEEEGPAGNGGSGTSSSSSGGGGGGGGGAGVGPSAGRAVAAPTHGSPSKLPIPSHVAPPMFSVSPSSMPASLPARARVTPPPPPQQQAAGSGVVAYMGGGEEMASPEGVDDADMQGLWHMLPSTGENSPALPRSHQPSNATPAATHPPRSSASTAPGAHSATAARSVERKLPQVKALGLSKIPVVGGAGGRGAKPPLPHGHTRHAISPGDKEPLSDEGYWDTPTATPTATPDESGLQRGQRMALSRDSFSGDHLYDLYKEPGDEDEQEDGDEDLTSTPSPSTERKLSPRAQTSPPSSTSSSSARSAKGSASLPRESKIPISGRQTTPPPGESSPPPPPTPLPPHSASQSSLSSDLEADAPPPKTRPPPQTRSRIPMSKLPVRSAGSKHGSANKGTSSKK